MRSVFVRTHLALAGGLLLSSCSAPEPPAPSPSPSPTASAAVAQGVKDLPPTAYQVAWGEFKPPATIKAGDQAVVKVAFKNVSPATWPSGAGTSGLMYTVRLSHRWLKAKPGAAPQEVVPYVGRVELPRSLAPGESATADITLVAPAAKGRYLVQVDLVHEGVTWFEVAKAATLTANVTVD